MRERKAVPSVVGGGMKVGWFVSLGEVSVGSGAGRKGGVASNCCVFLVFRVPVFLEGRRGVVASSDVAGPGADHGILADVLRGFSTFLSRHGRAPVGGWSVAVVFFLGACLNRCRGSVETCASFFLAHFCTDTATLWHRSIPD